MDFYERTDIPRQEDTERPELTGLVLSLQDFKEKDGIVKLALPDRVESIYARGVMKSTSKNRRLCNPFSKVTLFYEPKYSRDMYFLIRGDEHWFDGNIQEDLLGQSVCFVLRDMILRIGINPMVYHCLEQAWHAWNDGDHDEGYLYSCLALANLLKIAGIAPNLDSCSVCGQTSGIETLVLEEGGFVCKDCAGHRYPRKSREYLLSIRALFRAGQENIDYLAEHFQYGLQDVLDLAKWWEYHADSRLASVDFLQSVARLDSH